jgi:hypothetical protein
MLKINRTVLVLFGTASSCACDNRAPTVPAAAVEVSVAPFDLPEVTDVTYTLTLRNGDGDLVWVKENLRSSEYGTGDGSLTYIGTCDPATAPNTLELVIVDLYEGAAVIPVTEYENPCPISEPCILPANCEASDEPQNPIDFNLTVAMVGGSNKGFFDIAMRFSDIFCSAQLSCREGLLFIDSQRAKTHVLGFACVSGIATPTHLYLNDIDVECDDGVVALDPSLDKGNQAGIGPVGAWAIYRDNENLAGMRKGYWNTAFALEPDAANCHVSSQLTASERAFEGHTTPTHTTYPVIVVDFDLGDTSEPCHATQQLDTLPSGVLTAYTAIDETLCFTHLAEVKSTGLSVDSGSCP